MNKWIALLLALCLVLFGVAGTVSAEENSLFTNRDLTQEADLIGAEEIQLTGQSLTIDHAGIFVLSGEIENGQITIEAGDEDKVQLVLKGVTIHQQTGAAIEVKSADKVFITLAQGSENALSADNVTEDGVDGVIFSKADLTLNGLGQLTLTSQQGHGIVCKDTLAITGGNYVIQAAGHGITGKDALNIADGSFTITTGGGSKAVEMKAGDSFGGFGFSQSSAQSDEEIKAKGLKSDGSINVLYGSFTLDCADDAIHAGGNVTISDGTFFIQSADDAIHSDEEVTINDGSFEISYCYEGIEGKNVTIGGGTINITSNDDGINATGEDSATGFRVPGVDSGAVIAVNGGDLTIVSDGDCLDSNGTIILNGGTLNLTSNGNGNTALDSESGITNNGAQVTTNDGSENGGGFGRGQMGGGRGQFPGGGMGKFQENGQFPDRGQNRPDSGYGKGVTPPDGTSQPTPPANNTSSSCPCGSCQCFQQNVG